MGKKDKDINRFADIGYEAFRKMANDNALSMYEKIGFPDSYRKNYEKHILQDICSKVPALTKKSSTILDIGPGCSGLAAMEIELCKANSSTLIMVDSPEMLDQLPGTDGLRKFPGRFPDECVSLVEEYTDRIDGLIVYSVFHYIFPEGNPFRFLDTCLSMLAPQGRLLIADIPNRSMRKRFFNSDTGIRFHQQYTGTKEVPNVKFSCLDADCIDDSVMLSMVLRARQMGYDGYIVPQSTLLPMANRREDLLFIRP